MAWPLVPSSFAQGASADKSAPGWQSILATKFEVGLVVGASRWAYGPQKGEQENSREDWDNGQGRVEAQGGYGLPAGMSKSNGGQIFPPPIKYAECFRVIVTNKIEESSKNLGGKEIKFLKVKNKI